MFDDAVDFLEAPWPSTTEELLRYHKQLADLVTKLVRRYWNLHGNNPRKEVSPPRGRETSPTGGTHVKAYIESVIEPAYQVISSGQPARFVCRCEGRWVEFAIHPRTGQEGSVDHLDIRATDVTRRKSLKVVLRRCEERYRTLLSRALIGSRGDGLSH
jgi:hypothetical protein